jgi:hypothetical protein
MTTSQVSCKCGALYERTEFHSAPREADSFVCGHILEIFSDVKAPRYPVAIGSGAEAGTAVLTSNSALS